MVSGVMVHPPGNFSLWKMPRRGIVTAAELYNDPIPVNIGSGYEISIRRLAEIDCPPDGALVENWFGTPPSPTVNPAGD